MARDSPSEGEHPDLFRSSLAATHFQVVLKWITNPELHLARFVKRRVASSDCWNYVHTSVNSADIGTKNLDSIDVWFGGPAFLW